MCVMKYYTLPVKVQIKVSTFMKICQVGNNASFMAVVQNLNFIWANLNTRKPLPAYDWLP